MSKTSLLLAATAAIATLTGGLSVANARGGMGMHMHSITAMPMHTHDNNFFRHHRGLGLIVATTGSGCGYLYDRWIYTGDYYWKYKYNRCLGGW
jgi:hypothetical protein